MKIPAQEASLLFRSREQDPEALRELVERYVPPIYGFLYSLLGDKAGQEIRFLTAAFAESLRTLNPSKPKESFLVAVMRRIVPRLLAQLAHRQVRGSWPGLEPRLWVLFETLSQLPSEASMLILLRDQMDLSLEDIALVLSKNVRQVKPELNRARLDFRDQIKQTLSMSRRP